MSRVTFALFLLLAATPLLAQHDISQVDPATGGTASSTPLPQDQERRMKKYEVPEMAGAEEVLGSQLIDGRLPRPLIDFLTQEGSVTQRLSIFEGGLVVVKMTGAATIQKKVKIPPDALKSYLGAESAAVLRNVDPMDLGRPEHDKRALLRIYESDGSYVERQFNPSLILPKSFDDCLLPLRDLLRAISEDRGVTTTIAGYEPKAGDELVSDDQRVYRVKRVVEPAGVVELECLDAPTTIYVAKRDLQLYFVGRR